MRNSTIRDIATYAGVSVATVSRVINKLDNVSDETAKRVQDAIEALDYYPNRAARELKNQTTKTIAFIIADSTNEYYSQIAKAVLDVVRSYGYTLFLCNCFNDSEIEKNYLTMLCERKIDGIILNSCGKNDDLVTQLSHKIPIILIHRQIANARFVGDFVNVDFGAATYEMTTEFINNGHRKIGIISGPLFLSSARERFDNFCLAMKQIGVNVDSEYPYLQEGGHDSEFGYSAAKQLLSMEDPPTALVCGHNETCIGLLRYCREQHIDIPGQLSICAPCNVNTADLFYVNPAVALPDTRGLGVRIGKMLMERILSENPIKNREVLFMPTVLPGNALKQVD